MSDANFHQHHPIVENSKDSVSELPADSIAVNPLPLNPLPPNPLPQILANPDLEIDSPVPDIPKPRPHRPSILRKASQDGARKESISSIGSGSIGSVGKRAGSIGSGSIGKRAGSIGSG